ncbi:Bgh specific peptide [Blumeria hordei DH14]|uniref:Bgh specific peptide n=1 Tax=Blumeria graminis f. sp. hordei (strain DH14) TaxID=546991 RepID=N1JC85_BLUG1|nr:Bgh specific peptide [Blumeria hordei DH14]
MVSCAYAILFLQIPRPMVPETQSLTSYYGRQSIPYIKQQLPYSNRLVILGNQLSDSFYGVYQISSQGYFPDIDTEYGITSTNVQISGDGTYIKAYCSPDISALKIIEKVVYNLYEIRSPSLQNDKEVLAKKDACYNAINTAASEDKYKFALSASRLRDKQTCSIRDIISLAYDGSVSVDGNRKYYAPNNKNAKIRIDMDDYVDIIGDISRDHIYGNPEDKKRKTILAWYFGHLHVFELPKRISSWWPITNIGMTKENGALIEKFLRDHVGVFKKLDAIIKSYKSETTSISFDRLFRLSRVEGSERRKDQIMAEISMLTIEKLPEVFSNYK